MSDDRIKKIVEKFLTLRSYDGICGFTIIEASDNQFQVIIFIDLDWVKKFFTSPQRVAQGLREKVKKDIKRYTGFEVMVGSTGVEDCLKIKNS